MQFKVLAGIWWEQNIQFTRKIQWLSKTLSNFIWALNYLQFSAWQEKLEPNLMPLFYLFSSSKAQTLAGLHSSMSIKTFPINNLHLPELSDFHFQLFLDKVLERNTALQYKISEMHLFRNKNSVQFIFVKILPSGCRGLLLGCVKPVQKLLSVVDKQAVH